MDRSSISTLIWTAAVFLYGIYEYRRRDRRHRLDMEYLRRRIEPPPESELLVPVWRTVTVAITAFILIVGAAFFIFTGVRHPADMTPMIIEACVFLSLAAPLIYMIVRDRRLPRGKLRRRV
jgi:ABC-type Fe3+ transport system permease subunit